MIVLKGGRLRGGLQEKLPIRVSGDSENRIDRNKFWVVGWVGQDLRRYQISIEQAKFHLIAYIVRVRPRRVVIGWIERHPWGVHPTDRLAVERLGCDRVHKKFTARFKRSHCNSKGGDELGSLKNEWKGEI